MKKKTSLLLACIMIFALIAAGCGDTTTPTPTPGGTPTPTGAEKKVETLKIGIIQPLSGAVAYGGQQAANGGLLAIEEINEAGGVYNAKTDTYYLIQEIVCDDNQTPSESAAVAMKLITEDEVVFIMGAFSSSCSLAIAEVCNREKVPQMSPLSSAEALTNSGFEFFFRGRVATYNDIIPGAASFAKLANVDTWGQIAVNDDWGKGEMQLWPDNLGNHGDEFLIIETFESVDTDFYAICTKVLNANPEAIYVTASTEPFCLLTKQLRELNPDIPIFTSGGIDPQETLNLAGADVVDGIWFWSVDQPPTEESLAWDAMYEEWSGLPVMSNARSGYDTAQCVFLAIANADDPTDRISLRDALRQVEYTGLQGDYYFDERGESNLKQAYGIFDKRTEKGWALFTAEQIAAGEYETNYPGGRIPK